VNNYKIGFLGDLGRMHEVSCSSNESAVQQKWCNCIASWITLSVRFDWRNFTLALDARIPLQRFLYNFWLDYVGSGTLSNIHHSSMLLVIKMVVAGGHMSYVHVPPNKINCCVFLHIQINFNNFSFLWYSYIYFSNISSSKRSQHAWMSRMRS